MANSVPNALRSDCNCELGYFEWSAPQHDGPDASPPTCVPCPSGAECLKEGVRFGPEGPMAMALEAGRWQSREYVEDWSAEQLEEELEFYVCPLRDVMLADGSIERMSLCLGMANWDECYLNNTGQ